MPDPAAYVLHKFIISEKRLKEDKREKDLIAAKEIGEYILKDKKYCNRLLEIYENLPKKWQKTLKQNIKENSQLIYKTLI